MTSDAVPTSSHREEMIIMAFAYCPECGARASVGRLPKVGRMVFCECCDAGLRIVDLNPLQLDWVAETSDGGWDEDWEVEVEVQRAYRAQPRPQ
jgi:lysine biosynthesis protein LysW